MKLSKRDVGLLLILLGVAIILVCYFAIYNPNNEKNDILRSEIASLQPVLADLKAKEANVPVYREGIEESKATIQTIKNGYPGMINQEELIMYTVSIEDVIGIDTAGLSFAAPAILDEFEPIIENGEIIFEKTVASKVGLNLNANLTYLHLKDLVGFVYDRSIKTTLDSVNISYNAENGVLLGTLNISKYFLVSPSDPYVETYVPPMPVGTPNPFGSLEEIPLRDEDGNYILPEDFDGTPTLALNDDD